MTAQLHPATESCLEALQWLATRQRFTHILDIGCGSGLLSVVSAGLWQPSQVLATDIAPQAVIDTGTLSQAHGLDHCIKAIRSDGFNHALIASQAPYDLIICNLLAEPITQWAPQMKAHIKPQGICLLSGILAWLAPPLEEAYRQLGFDNIHTIHRSPWVTYVMRAS